MKRERFRDLLGRGWPLELPDGLDDDERWRLRCTVRDRVIRISHLRVRLRVWASYCVADGSW